MKRLLLGIVLSAGAAAAPLFAHHSFSAYYFEDQRVSIEGQVVEFEYRSPHAWVHVMVRDAEGQTRKYSVEWANPNNLRRQQITKDTLKAGDFVIVTGSPARNAAEYKLHLKGIERPADGWKWAQGRR